MVFAFLFFVLVFAVVVLARSFSEELVNGEEGERLVVVQKSRRLSCMRNEGSPNSGRGRVNGEERKNMGYLMREELHAWGEHKESENTRDFGLGDKVNDRDIKVGNRRSEPGQRCEFGSGQCLKC